MRSCFTYLPELCCYIFDAIPLLYSYNTNNLLCMESQNRVTEFVAGISILGNENAANSDRLAYAVEVKDYIPRACSQELRLVYGILMKFRFVVA